MENIIRQEGSVWKSKVDTKSSDFVRRHKEFSDIVEDLNKKLREGQEQGSETAIQRHRERNQLLPRERVDLLLDQDSPQLELCPLAGYGQEEKCPAVGASLISVIGLVCGIECVVSCSMATVKGGAINKRALEKSLRISEIASQNRLPTISLIQTAGADLRQQDKVFHKGGAIFRELARHSKAGIPTIVVVFGSSTAGGAYNPGMADYVIMVKGKAKVFLGGPPLVEMATGEIVDDESLGGAEMHSRTSGVSDFLANDEHSALHKARELVRGLNWQKVTALPSPALSFVEPPLYSADEILGVASWNIKEPYDSRELIARVVDGSKFEEFKPLYGYTLVTCFSNISGFPVGILANNGVLFSESACKATQFLELCNQRKLPVIFLQNITGFMVGKRYEEGGIIKHGAKFINAVSNYSLPMISINVGASYGAGNYAMCGRSYQPRFLFSWPNSKCSVMGSEQLTGVMDIVMRQAAKKAGRQINEEQANMRKSMLKEDVDKKSDVYYTSSKILDDGVIDPRDTRYVLSICLSVVYSAPLIQNPMGGVSRL